VALAETSGLKPQSAVILMDGQPAGAVHFMEIRAFFGLVHGITLDRGPVWYAGYGGAHQMKAFFDEFNRLYPARPLRWRRLIPEIEDSPVARKMLEAAGLRRMGEGYQTFLLDLAAPLDGLRANLDQKWRNILNRAERDEGLSIVWDTAAQQLPWVLKVYDQDKRRKNYAGPTPQLLRALAMSLSSSGDIIIGRVIKEDMAVSAVLIARHGHGATYLAGWTGETGRAAGAHHLLLWSAIGVLQEMSVKTFDLGGFNEQDAKGIKHFKQGLGGRPYILVGRYA